MAKENEEKIKELKALVYDCIVARERYSTQINQLNQEIARLEGRVATPPASGVGGGSNGQSKDANPGSPNRAARRRSKAHT